MTSSVSNQPNPEAFRPRVERASRAWSKWLLIYAALTLSIIVALRLLKGIPVHDWLDVVSVAMAIIVLGGSSALLGAAVAAIIKFLFRVRRGFKILWSSVSFAILIAIGGLMLVQA